MVAVQAGLRRVDLALNNPHQAIGRRHDIPYPFAGTSASFTLLRRIVPARPWTQAEFRRGFFDIEPTLVEIELAA